MEQRVTRLEHGLTQIREEWTVVQQTPLIQGRLFNALRATQLEHSLTLDEHSLKLDEHSRKLDEHSATLAEHTVMLAAHSAKLDEHSAKLDLLGRGQETIIGMLTTLIDREPGERG